MAGWPGICDPPALASGVPPLPFLSLCLLCLGLSDAPFLLGKSWLTVLVLGIQSRPFLWSLFAFVNA